MASSGSTHKWRVWLSAYAPLILWVGVIFFFSSPEGAFSNTSRIIGPLLQFFFPDMSEASRMIIHGYVRKAAHFTEYAVLAFLGIRALTLSSSTSLLRLRYILPLILVAVIAVLDEFNQSFLASRTSSIYDVAIDITGGAVMTVTLWLLGRPRVSVEESEIDETADIGQAKSS